ncbi:phage major capsid protein [Citromicrobium bathyomarinum]|uniref:phage major capsid protein n=1 Tax=Citromicrobium bathyomarinum TaxID=72174 RepID=UPI003159D196
MEITHRQSEIRQELATLAGNDNPTEDETRSMAELDKEYRANETRYRAAIIAEDEERREAGKELETRSETEWADMMSSFEVRQVAAALDHGAQLSGQTAEIVQEMRSHGAYQGIPLPLEALEVRNTVSTGTVEPKQTQGIFDRLFPTSVASRLGVNSVSIPFGTVEYPVATQGAVAGWAATEGGNVPNATAFQTTETTLSPDQTLGAHMRISRKAVKQTGPGLEQAIRRDMAAAIGSELDRAILVGDGADGEPTGLVELASGTGTWAATWPTVRTEIIAFMTANAISDPSAVRMAITPDMWADLDDAIFDDGSGQTEWTRLTSGMGNPILSTQLSADTALLAVSAGGLAPAYLGMWGGVDMIRDPYSDAQSGGLRLTGLLTVDLKVPRASQLRVLSAGS